MLGSGRACVAGVIVGDTWPPGPTDIRKAAAIGLMAVGDLLNDGEGGVREGQRKSRLWSGLCLEGFKRLRPLTVTTGSPSEKQTWDEQAKEHEVKGTWGLNTQSRVLPAREVGFSSRLS